MAKEIISQPRDFPSVEELLQDERLVSAIALVPRPAAAQIVKEAIAKSKKKLGERKTPLTFVDFLAGIEAALSALKRTEISRVINATGVIVHTNLGRAPLSEAMFDSVRSVLSGYSNVEFDLATGARGSRGIACERYLALLAEAESGTVVNNCAAALFVILNTLANHKAVLISRGELVQIGGGFRIPDILKRAGARLSEVGTTNITTLADYENAIDERTALILKVHKSNFIQAGFTEEVPLRDLVALGHKHKLPVINDLGSGVFVPTKPILGYAEPTVQQSVRAGAHLTCFSGDKMLGGMQAGLIVGRSELIAQVKKNPLFRTARVDKVVFAMLERLLRAYLDGTSQNDIALWRMLSMPVSDLYRHAKDMIKRLGNPEGLSVEATKAFIGGGALPESDIPSVAVVFGSNHNAEELMAKSRALPVPVIGRIEDDRFLLDLKAVDPADFPAIEDAIRSIIS
ncbi:MAG TPA: L-seryl-tRNA(Sec) selenium transferase [Candidatus Acidoferrum sp.]|nr:L-seryl-tRNA(Sec) selenium transferase [Candidatus Acidoferrum sp.]